MFVCVVLFSQMLYVKCLCVLFCYLRCYMLNVCVCCVCYLRCYMLNVCVCCLLSQMLYVKCLCVLFKCLCVLSVISDVIC